jgi:betaine-homocysteine S-methyltransferase
MNRQALQIAKSVAHESGALFAGDIGNTNLFEPDDKSASSVVRAMFDEQTEWAIDAGVDMIIVETFYYAAEALVALDAARAAGVPVVVTLAMFDSNQTRDGWPIADACRRLEDAGASVVGLNCIRGPHTILPLLKEVRAAVKCPVAALPVPFRTTEAEPTFQLLTDPCYHGQPNGRPYPTALEPFTCTRYEMGDFAREAYALGVRYLGVCCGGGPQHVRSMAEALGRQPPASRYSADLANRAFLDQRLKIRG